MQIRILSSTLVGGVWHEPGIGNYDPALARHLIGLGVAEALEPTEVKKKPVEVAAILSSSQPDQASPRKTASKPRGRPRKS